MTSYYDIILGLIPLVLFAGAGTLTLLGVQPTVAVPTAALVSVGLIGHALFVNGPSETTPQAQTSASAKQSSAPTSD
ncbi:hypothetical protein [Halalkalicoccus ordinarius]|uniref:hypothetical protein n=1 Tax=Halalkalicoccus ordinarius TaxID=3116651 RepID=UPI00300EF5ED